MKYVQGFERLMAGLMMLMLILLAGDLVVTLDKRQASFEKKLTSSVDAMSVKLNGTVNSKFEELRGDVTAELHPVALSAKKTLDQTAALLSTAREQAGKLDIPAINGKVKQFDVVGLNTSIAAIGPAFTQAGAALSTTATDIGQTTSPLNAILAQVNLALPDFLDCQVTEDGVGNKSCLSIRYDDLTSDLDKTINAVTLATPKIVTSVEGMASDGKGITGDAKRYVDAFVAPKTKWEKVEGFAESFGTILLLLLEKGAL